MTTPVKEVKVLEPKDFNFLINSGNRDRCAEIANKILNEKLVKYYAYIDDEGIMYVGKDKDIADTHTLLGFEPEPIAEEKKVETSIKEIKEVCALHGLNDKTTDALIKYFSAGEL